MIPITDPTVNRRFLGKRNIFEILEGKDDDDFIDWKIFIFILTLAYSN